jgi:hypothetical protein
MGFPSLVFVSLSHLCESTTEKFNGKSSSFLFQLVARSISDDLSSGDAARFRDDEYGKSEVSGMGGSSARNDSAHKGERDKEKKEKDKEEFEGL